VPQTCTICRVLERVRPRKGRRPAALVYHRSIERDPRADRGRALDGVAWLAASWDLRDLRGELVEPWLVAPGLDRGAFERLAFSHSGPVRSFFAGGGL